MDMIQMGHINLDPCGWLLSRSVRKTEVMDLDRTIFARGKRGLYVKPMTPPISEKEELDSRLKVTKCCDTIFQVPNWYVVLQVA